MDYTDIKEIKADAILSEFKRNSQYTCTLPYTSRDSDIFLSKVLKIVLDEVEKGNLHSYLEFTLNELSMNASKANSKRLYFKRKKLDLANPEHYGKGMATFKKEVIENFSDYEQGHIKEKYYVKVELSIRDNVLDIKVINNSPMTIKEKERILERLKNARKFENLTDVISHGFDTIEGGGFGLIIIVLMLRKINLDEKALSFSNSSGISVSSVKIPLNLLSKEQGILIADEITDEINTMPQFPQSIISLQNELRNPNCSFESVAENIKSDMSLCTEILRIANSPVYMVRNKVSDIESAIRLVGMLGVKSILYNYGVNKILSIKYNKKAIDEINDHSFQVAMIAAFLARSNKLGRLGEEAYVAGLLHDLGKIVVKSLHRELENKIEKICREKNIPVSVLDDLTDGYNHSLIGAKIARKWDFPENFISVIGYHHLPLEVDEKYKILTYIVYLSNEIYYFIHGGRDFKDINYLVLSHFNLQQENDFQDLVESLSLEGLGL